MALRHRLTTVLPKAYLNFLSSPIEKGHKMGNFPRYAPIITWTFPLVKRFFYFFQRPRLKFFARFPVPFPRKKREERGEMRKISRRRKTHLSNLYSIPDSFFILAKTLLKFGSEFPSKRLYAHLQHLKAFSYSCRSQYAAATDVSNTGVIKSSPNFLFA